jgi:hypothetical protein
MWLAVTGGIDGASADTAVVRYDAGMGALMGTVTGLSLLELAVVHLIVPWPAVQVVLLVLGAWTVLIVLGFWAGLRAYPHLVSSEGLQLRYAQYLRIHVPWEQVDEVRRATLHEPTSITVRDGRLHLPVSGSTNLVLTLREERDVPLLLGRTRRAREVAFVADDPIAALAAVREKRPPGP